MRTTGRRGNLQIEFLVTLTTLAAVALGIGRTAAVLAERQVFVHAVFEVGRYAATGPTPPSNAQVSAWASSVLQAKGLDPTGLQLQLTRGTDGEDPTVRVRAELPVRRGLGGAWTGSHHVQEFTFVVTGSEP